MGLLPFKAGSTGPTFLVAISDNTPVEQLGFMTAILARKSVGFARNNRFND